MWTKPHAIDASCLCHPHWQEIDISWNVKKTLLEVILPTTHPQNPFQDSLGIYYRKIVQSWVICLIDVLYKYQTWTFIHRLKVKVFAILMEKDMFIF